MKFPKTGIKDKAASANAAARAKLPAARRVTAVILAVSLIAGMAFLLAPTLRKRAAINSAGDTVMRELTAVPSLLAYYDEVNITSLAQDPFDVNAYTLVSEALTVVRTSGGYDSAILVVQSGKQYLCIADSLYGSGLNYYAAGSLLSPDKSVKTLLGKIYSGESDGGVAADIVESRMGESSACVLLPIGDGNGDIIAVLAVETGVKGAPFHIAGAVNLYAVGAVFAVIALIAALMLFMFIKLAQKPEGAEKQDKNAPAEREYSPERENDTYDGGISAEEVANTVFGRGEAADTENDADTDQNLSDEEK